MRKFFLILIIAFAVVGFGYPCIILPYTNYTYTYEQSEGNFLTTSYKFKLNGKVDITASLVIDGEAVSSSSTENFYKLSFRGGKVLISEDENFDDATELVIRNFYTITPGMEAFQAYNSVAVTVSIIVGVFALFLVITIPSRRRR